MNGLRGLAGCPVPPGLERAMGYDGELRYVAFYWTPYGDEVVYDDGTQSGDGDWQVWLLYVRHPKIRPFLTQLELGSSDTEARHWLLLDCQARFFYCGEVKAVRKFLNRQVPVQLVDTPPVLRREDLQKLNKSLKERPPVTMEEIHAIMRQRTKKLAELREWLDCYTPPRVKETGAVAFPTPFEEVSDVEI